MMRSLVHLIVVISSMLIVSCSCSEDSKIREGVSDSSERREAIAEAAQCDNQNPYDEGSGHYAGYEWADENNVSDCGGNSESFIEGCEEYLSQMRCLQSADGE